MYQDFEETSATPAAVRTSVCSVGTAACQCGSWWGGPLNLVESAVGVHGMHNHSRRVHQQTWGFKQKVAGFTMDWRQLSWFLSRLILVFVAQFSIMLKINQLITGHLEPHLFGDTFSQVLTKIPRFIMSPIEYYYWPSAFYMVFIDIPIFRHTQM